MSDYNWCHGPSCHTNKTQDRIRGVKGSKVLRTRKIKTYNGNQGFYNWFCSQSCERDFCNKYTQQIIACLLYTSPSPRDGLLSRMPSSA